MVKKNSNITVLTKEKHDNVKYVYYVDIYTNNCCDYGKEHHACCLTLDDAIMLSVKTVNSRLIHRIKPITYDYLMKFKQESILNNGIVIACKQQDTESPLSFCVKIKEMKLGILTEY